MSAAVLEGEWDRARRRTVELDADLVLALRDDLRRVMSGDLEVDDDGVWPAATAFVAATSGVTA